MPATPVPGLLAAKALEIAASYLGVTEHPPHSNRGPEVDAFLRSVGLNPEAKSYPWCAAMVSYCVEQAAEALHMPLRFRRTASCARMAELNYRLEISGPEPGAVFIHLNPDHTGHAGFVTQVLPGGLFRDISGNSDANGSRTGGSVCSNVRPISYAAHFLRLA